MIGSNLLRNTNGVFTAHGKEQLRIEVGKDDGQLLLTMEIYMPTGTPAGKLDRNTWVSTQEDRFEITTEKNSLKVTDTTLKYVVIELKEEEDHRITVTIAKFYTSNGVMSEVSHDWWQVGNKMELKGADLDLGGGSIEMPE